MLKFASVLSLLVISWPGAAAADAPKDLLAAGRVDQAIQSLQQQIHDSPSAESYNLLCRAYFALDEWDAGISACEKAVSLEPNNGLYHLWLARAYGEKADRVSFISAAGMAKKVRSEFERSVALNPDNWEARTDLAEFYLEAPGIVGGGKDKARAQAKEIGRMNPAMAHWVIGRIAEKEKDNARAEQEYRAAVDSSHDGAHAWLNLAIFYKHVGRLDEMVLTLHTMETRPLDRPESLMDGASMLLRTNRDLPLAVHLLRRYLESPATVEQAPVFKAHYLLGEVLEKQGDRQAAAGEYRACLALAHSFGRAQDSLKRVER